MAEITEMYTGNMEMAIGIGIGKKIGVGIDGETKVRSAIELKTETIADKAPEIQKSD